NQSAGIPYQQTSGQVMKDLAIKEEVGQGDELITVYEDAQGNEYSYDYKNDLVAYRPASAATAVLTDGLTQSVAKTKADPYGKAFCGDDFEKFVFDRVTVLENRGEYRVNYAEKFSDFISGESLTVVLHSDGSLKNILRPGKGDLNGFDPKILANITEKTLRDFVQKEIDAKYSDCASFEMWDAVVGKKEGAFVLEIPVTLVMEDNSVTSSSVITLDYLL
ncbi:MAG: hypothetical protein IJN42_07020, partial [Clostridia bacterium]|nr:hypothetical protein [Clostridia bacterium]